MNVYRWLLVMLFPTLIVLSSCGGSSDGKKHPSEEQGSTGTTGGTTGGTTTGGGGSSCMTASQKTSIKSFFDQSSLQSPFHGKAVDSFRNPDGTFTTENFDNSTIILTKTSDNSWRVDATYCASGVEACTGKVTEYSVAGTCFTQDGLVVNIRSASSSRLSIGVNHNDQVPPLRETSVFSVPTSGRARVTSTYTMNGLQQELFSFVEDGGSTTSSSSAAAASSADAAAASADAAAASAEAAATTAAAATTGGTTGGTTGATGTTTGGFSSMMNGL